QKTVERMAKPSRLALRIFREYARWVYGDRLWAHNIVTGGTVMDRLADPAPGSPETFFRLATAA
ncbi:hypothetical protein BG015_005450, partial [Linnemannia schmuckeri]